MTQTQTAQTAVGEVEYKTRTCVNCQNEVLEGEAIQVGIDKYESMHGHRSYIRREHLCDHCADTLFNYRRAKLEHVRQNVTDDPILIEMQVVAWCLLAALWAIVAIGVFL